ncbi:HAMP domain-containing sensor histidine kinase [Sphaerisporangium sp. NPDC051017]|uniref:sensor histidine kinase n=1 Tax=Sphaerisporangium sp. NPDC051017 TaxID=3154636 RepID=UPI00343F6E0F
MPSAHSIRARSTPATSALLTEAGRLLAAGGAVLPAFGVWMTWSLMGRSLRPPAAIRTRMSQIMPGHLGLRVPVPPHEDEIALLARSADQALDPLETTVEQQRRFALTACHELGAPVADLREHLRESLLRPGEADPRDAIRLALSATGRLETIVDDVLYLARLGAGDAAGAPRELIDTGALVLERAARPHGVPVRVHATAGMWVCGVRAQLTRMLDTILDGAGRAAETRVDVMVRSHGDEVVVTVTDDGAAVSPADRARVFDPFSGLDDPRRRDPDGSGLGLTIAREIARAHHGTVEAEDSARGLRFAIRLPLMNAGDPGPGRPGAERDGSGTVHAGTGCPSR